MKLKELLKVNQSVFLLVIGKIPSYMGDIVCDPVYKLDFRKHKREWLEYEVVEVWARSCGELGIRIQKEAVDD